MVAVCRDHQPLAASRRPGMQALGVRLVEQVFSRGMQDQQRTDLLFELGAVVEVGGQFRRDRAGPPSEGATADGRVVQQACCVVHSRPLQRRFIIRASFIEGDVLNPGISSLDSHFLNLDKVFRNARNCLLHLCFFLTFHMRLQAFYELKLVD